MAASHSITSRCCPPCPSTAMFTPAQASPYDNLSAGPNLSKGFIWKTGPLENSPKPWICLGRAAHPTHKTRQGPCQPSTLRKEKALLYFTLRGDVVLQEGKRRTLYSGRSQRERRVLGRLPELSPYWLHPRLFEEKLGLSKLSASLLRLCIL